MKKLLSLALVSVMLFAVVAGAIPAQAVDAFNVDEVEAKYFDVKPTIDGYISEAEWGAPLVLAEQSDAQTVGGQSPTPNRFFATANGGGYDAATLSMSYMLWLSWDENYFYIGAKVNDPDGHSLRNGRGETWDGDALQVRIDPEGANAVNGGFEFDPALDSTDRKPWGSANVCDLLFGYCLNAGGYKEAWNNTIDVNKGMLANNAYTQSMGLVDMAIATAGSSYTSDTQNGITTYEVAIPWSYIDYNNPGRQHNYYKYALKDGTDKQGNKQGPGGAIGVEYGMSAVVLNADGASGGNHWNALLTWGSGIVGIQHTDENYKTCAGSNAVILSGDKVSEDPSYNAGYAKYTVGGPEPTPIVKDYDTEKKDPVILTYDNEDDMNTFGTVSNGERVQLDDGNWVVKWDKVTDRDLDEWDPVANPTEPTHNTHNYLSTDGELPDGADARWEATGNKGPSFTFEFDMMVTDLVTFENGYSSYLANWFGGTSAIDYQCGYFFDDSKFKIVNTTDPSEIVAQANAELTLNEWHHWVFQYDNETCVLRFYFDPAMDGDMVSSEAQPVFNLKYKYFDYGSIEKTIAIFRRMNAQIMMDNVQFYNFVDFSKGKIIDKDQSDNDNGGYVPPVEKDEVVDVDTTVEKLADGSFALAVPNTEAFKAANVKAVSFTVSYDAAKVSFKGVDTIDEKAVEITDDGNGNAVIKIKDLAVLKNVEAGATLLRVIVAPKVDGLEAEDVKSIVTIKATVTTVSAATGDTVIWVSAALLVVLALGTGVVVYRRKRSTVEF
ncbi:MAG: hypothetical protein E7660_02080 [Ruminococcaceae bacterium]|nr:hypothetical protein [Oscillospiraceae bacterium]